VLMRPGPFPIFQELHNREGREEQHIGAH